MSPTAVRRPGAPKAPAAEGVNFGDLGFYSAGFLLPEGDYAMFHEVKVHAYTKQDGSRGQEMLGVMLSAYPLAGGEPVEQFLSMGRKAMLSFMPDPDTGKKLVKIPGTSGTLAGLTNWNLYLSSLYDCGLPPGVFENDITVLDGIWVHTANVPEPESRKRIGAATGEVAQQQADRGPQMIPVVTEIKDDGKPWEGGGGLPEGAAEAAPAKPAPKVAPKAAAAKAPVKAAVKVPAKKAAPVEEEAEGPSEELAKAAEDCIATVLGANPKGCPRLKLRTGTFNAAKGSYDDDTAQAIIDTFFGDDDSLNSVLGNLGFTVDGTNIVVSA